MRSIKEKAEEHGKKWYQRNGLFLRDRCRGCYAHVMSSYEAGSNYVLEQITEAIRLCDNDRNTDLYKSLWNCIEQLRKE